MIRRGACALAVIAGLIAARAGHADPATAAPRVAHVAEALAAVRALGADGRDRLDRALYDAARGACHADRGDPPASCLVAAAQAICAGDGDRDRCLAAADVILANLRAAPRLVDAATRMRLVRASADYRVGLAAELARRYALLAAELALDGGDGDAAAIDRLCRRRDLQLHACAPGDAACVPSLPWSRCVAALVWFVGGR